MSNLLDRSIFGIYETFSNIIPGFIVLVTGWEFVSAVSSVQIPPIETNAFLVFLLFMSFVVGVAIQALSGLFETLVNRKSGRYPSSRLLDSKDTSFSDDIKNGIRRQAHETFLVSENADSQNIFDLCCTYIIQNGISQRVSQFLNMYTFARNMTVAMLIECVILICWYGFTSIIEMLFFAFLCLGLTGVFYLRFRRYSESFAKEVFRSFYVDRLIQKKKVS